MRNQNAITGQTRISRELNDAELDQVSGGLNPQPLPPRQAFSYFTISSVKTYIPSDPI
jgi:bacteriocin-like protein